MGIECDGATYHSSKTARDRDRLRRAILEEHGWNIHRIWSTEWFRNQDAEVRRLSEALEHVVSRRDRNEIGRLAYDIVHPIEKTASPVDLDQLSQSKPLEDQCRPSGAQEERSLRALPSSKAAPYQTARLNRGSNISEIHQASRHIVESMILECVTVEGPVHIDLLVKRIASAWGYERAGSRIRNRIERDLSKLVLRGNQIRRSGDFLSLPQQTVSKARGVDENGVVRRIDWVPLEEIRIAFAFVLQRSLSLSKQEMVTETARYLGYDRTGPAVKTRLELELGRTESDGLLEFINGRYRLTSTSRDDLLRESGIKP